MPKKIQDTGAPTGNSALQMEFANKNIDQIVKFYGDGKLKDCSKCAEEFRVFLKHETAHRLAEHARYCLDNKFEDSGLVLQDVVNEIGRRLGFTVKNGRFKGKAGEPGYDGLWHDSDGNLIIIEVKTTDAYRINLDTIFGYESKISAADKGNPKAVYGLIVVGRKDTGDLEAQVRGSRHAWTTRLISIDALIKLMFVAEGAASPSLVSQARQILIPLEFTRVDQIIDLVLTAQDDKEFSNNVEAEEQDIDSDPPKLTAVGLGLTHFKPEVSTKTNMALLEEKRVHIANVFFQNHNAAPPTRVKKRPLFVGFGEKLRACIAVSKRYDNVNQPYWYALHTDSVAHIEKISCGFFVLGCMDLDNAFYITCKLLKENLDSLNITDDGHRKYWHIVLRFDSEGQLCWFIPKSKQLLNLTNFSFKL